MKTQTMKTTFLFSAFVTLCVLVLTVSRVAASPAQSAEQADETYMWYGELVALDEGTRTMTVKTTVVGDQAPAELGHFKAGDRIALTWSGMGKYASGILSSARYVAGTKWERFTFPVEFVSFDTGTKYVTFRVEIPAASIPAVKALKPGEWIAATSPQGASRENMAIVKVVPYVDSWRASATAQPSTQVTLRDPAERSNLGRLALTDQLRRELLMLPHYGIFDWLESVVEPNGTVVLRGEVVNPTTRKDAEARIKKLESVSTVVNQIEVLPMSTFDDETRVAVYRALVAEPQLTKYFTRAVSPIHVVVKNGRVTLKGLVGSDHDLQLAYKAASRVANVFEVTNRLAVERSEAHQQS